MLETSGLPKTDDQTIDKRESSFICWSNVLRMQEKKSTGQGQDLKICQNS